jgi:hypothetical protein
MFDRINSKKKSIFLLSYRFNLDFAILFFRPKAFKKGSGFKGPWVQGLSKWLKAQSDPQIIAGRKTD